MQILSVRGNKSYDLLRAGLERVNAPKNVFELLPKFSDGVRYLCEHPVSNPSVRLLNNS